MKELNTNFIQINETVEFDDEENTKDKKYTDEQKVPSAVKTWYSCLTVEYYQPYFAVDEEIVFNRLKHGFLP
jgi:hypothetical protein